MSAARLGWAGGLALMLAGACGGTSGAPSRVTSCYDQCDAESNVPACKPLIGNASCRALCDKTLAWLPADCGDVFASLYSCLRSVPLGCENGLVLAKSSGGCQSAAFEQCLKRATKAPCVGSTDAGSGTPACPSIPCAGTSSTGMCPTVQCACPNGVTPIASAVLVEGFCGCVDETNCQLLCDIGP